MNFNFKSSEIIGSTIYNGCACIAVASEKGIIVLCNQNNNYRIIDKKEVKKVFRQIYESLI